MTHRDEQAAGETTVPVKAGRWSLARVAGGREDWVMPDSNPNHMCPYCDLMFAYHVEVKDHILHDHPEHASVVATIDPHELPHE